MTTAFFNRSGFVVTNFPYLVLKKIEVVKVNLFL